MMMRLYSLILHYIECKIILFSFSIFKFQFLTACVRYLSHAYCNNDLKLLLNKQRW